MKERFFLDPETEIGGRESNLYSPNGCAELLSEEHLQVYWYAE